jgi:hypothetical protein
MSRDFLIIKKKNLPDEARITGFTFLKEPTREDKEKRKFDFIEFSNGKEIGCMSTKRKSYAFSKGYVQVDNKVNTFVEVKTRTPFLLLLLIPILLLLLLLRSCSPEVPVISNKPIFDLTQDSDIEYGDRATKSKEEIQEELNQKVAEGMMNISMNLNPIFEDGNSKGNLFIVNEKINRHPQIVEIYTKNTQELIYKSGLIPVGSRIDYAKLSVDLEKGEYPCIAYFNSINEETGDLLGKAGAEILIVIQK